jgi:DNA mismatch endonuclease (patch repair protein)
MADTLTVQQRRLCMSRVRAKNTTPEMIVRRTIHRIGYRFRLHQKELPGTPDVVLPRHRAVILVHGCFWHQHPRCPRAGLPASNKEFWANKLEGNRRRDARNLRALKRQGWRVLVLWECQIRDQDRLERRLGRFLGRKPAGTRNSTDWPPL